MKDHIKKLKEEQSSQKKNQELIDYEQGRLDSMVKDEIFNVESANLVLSPNQMIYIPKNIGVSDIVVKQKRVVYINDFHFD